MDSAHLCPYCDADCSPIAFGCEHFFCCDSENGMRHTSSSREMEQKCAEVNTMFFNELLFHNDEVRDHLRIRRGIYDGSVEMYFYADSIDQIENEIGKAVLKQK